MKLRRLEHIATTVLTATLCASLGLLPVRAYAGPAEPDAKPDAETDAKDDAAGDAAGAPEGEGPAEGDDGTPTEEPGPEPDSEDAERAAALQLYLEGSQAYETGRFPQAIAKFEEAYALTREPLLLFNIGQSHWRHYDVDPNVEHLRKAKLFFGNFDQQMRGREDYNPRDTKDKLTAIDAQIDVAERADEIRRKELALIAADRRQRELLAQRKRVNRALIISGNTIIVVGSLMAVVGIAGLAVRGANRVVLENQDSGTNPASASEDKRRRDAYLTGGRLAFAGFVTAGIMLPAGIALRVSGGVRARRDKDTAEALGKDKPKKTKVSFRPGSLLSVYF